jgi:flotillin
MIEKYLPIIIVSIIAFILLITIIGILRRYRRCPSDKILVIYGKIGKSKAGQHRSAMYRWWCCIYMPIFQNYQLWTSHHAIELVGQTLK